MQYLDIAEFEVLGHSVSRKRKQVSIDNPYVEQVDR